MIQKLLRKLNFCLYLYSQHFPQSFFVYVVECLVSYKLRSYNSACTLHPTTNLPLLSIRMF